jgi:hypothetical protein
MSLIQGTVSLIIFLLITWILRKVLYIHIFYSFLAGLFSMTPAYFLHIYILCGNSNDFLPSLGNYWIWQLNLSIVINLYINHIKRKDLEA